jgi:transposase InsO family protein
MLRCNSTGDLYTLPQSNTSPSTLLAASSSLWHQRLGHPAPAALDCLNKNNSISCTKVANCICHACQLGKHTRLPFSSSTTQTAAPFELLHCDVWTSPINSISGFSYYLVILDNYSHFCWTFPLRRKSEVHQHIVEFVAYARTQFGLPVKCLQADNGTEFVNNATSTFLAAHGILLRLSCPYTSAQNGKAERTLRTLNNSVRTLLLHASMPPLYWAEALAAACYLLNRRPSSSIHSEVPYTRLFREQPTYDHIRVFGCLCYPNLQATSAHKLASRSMACVFLGYPSSHKGYRCLDLSTRRIIISRHVIFDESRFPFADGSPAPDSSLLDFLVDDTMDTMPCSTNPAASPLSARPSPAAPAAAPFPEDIEQPPSPPLHAGPGGRGPVPPPGPAASTALGGRGLVPLPGLQQARPAAPRDPAGLIPALLHVYVHRPLAPTSPPVPVPAAASESSWPVTRTQSRVIPLVQYRGLTATTPSPILANYRSGLADPNWHATIADEYKALMDNGTWRLVPRPPGANVVSGKWIFKHKYHSDGTLARHKARWVVRGFSQQHGIDYDETFHPVVKPPTIRAVLSIAASRSWPIR